MPYTGEHTDVITLILNKNSLKINLWNSETAVILWGGDEQGPEARTRSICWVLGCDAGAGTVDF